MRTHRGFQSVTAATIALALLLLLALALAACGGSDDTAATSPSASASPKATPTSTATPAPIPVIKVKHSEPPPPFAELAKMYDYMADEPLGSKDVGTANVRGLTVRLVEYMSCGYEVGAILLFPDGEGPFPVVLCGGWDLYTGGADNVEHPIKALLEAGCGALSVDGSALRPPGHNEVEDDPVGTSRAFVQQAVDMRRGLDVLETLPQVDAERIGCFGYGHSAFSAALLAGVDDRVKAYVIALDPIHDKTTMAGQLSIVDGTRYLGHNKGASFLYLVPRAVSKSSLVRALSGRWGAAVGPVSQ